MHVPLRRSDGRVSGQLLAVHFRDGDLIRQGQLLFTIDDRPFVALLNEARARARAARTALALARAEYAHASVLPRMFCR